MILNGNQAIRTDGGLENPRPIIITSEWEPASILVKLPFSDFSWLRAHPARSESTNWRHILERALTNRGGLPDEQPNAQVRLTPKPSKKITLLTHTPPTPTPYPLSSAPGGIRG